MTLDYTSVWRDIKICQTVTNVNSLVVNPAHIVQGQPQKKGTSSAVVRQCELLKYVNNVSCINQLCSVKHTKCSNCCKRFACRGRTRPVLGNLGSLGDWTKSLTNAERGLHPPLLDQTKQGHGPS